MANKVGAAFTSALDHLYELLQHNQSNLWMLILEATIVLLFIIPGPHLYAQRVRVADTHYCPYFSGSRTQVKPSRIDLFLSRPTLEICPHFARSSRSDALPDRAANEPCIAMNIPGLTWRGESIDDIELLPTLPPALVRILAETNGFILHHGALHVRGASLAPEWHSLRAAWQGPTAFCSLYDCIEPTDVPFAQDQLGDQFFLRAGGVLRLSAETGDIEPLADSLGAFLQRVREDIEAFLNVGLGYTLQPGQLLCAYPPFVFRQSGSGASLKPVLASEVILFHANLARQIRNVPDGEQVQFKIVD